MVCDALLALEAMKAEDASEWLALLSLKTSMFESDVFIKGSNGAISERTGANRAFERFVERFFVLVRGHDLNIIDIAHELSI